VNTAITSAASFLVNNIPQMSSDYERAISAYALVLTNSPQHVDILQQLENSAAKVVEGVCLCVCKSVVCFYIEENNYLTVGLSPIHYRFLFV